MDETRGITESNTVQADEHILLCLSPAPSNVRIIRTAARMAEAYHGILTALFVETPDFAAAAEEDRSRLQAHTRLAQELGASVEHVYGDDISYQIAEFARLNGVTKIVVGHSSAADRRLFWRNTLTDRLIAFAPNTEIYIIPDSLADSSYRIRRGRRHRAVFSWRDTAKSAFSLLLATALSLFFYRYGFTDANIITVYILGVLITSVATDHMIYGVLSSVASVFIFNYLFTDPRYTLLAYDIGYPMTFLVMLLASLLTGTLAARMKDLARQAARSAYRTKILLDTNQLLQQAEGREAIVRATADQLSKLTGRETEIHLRAADDAGAAGNTAGDSLSAAGNAEDDSLSTAGNTAGDSLSAAGNTADASRSTAESTAGISPGAAGSTAEGGRVRYPIRMGDKIYGAADIDVREHPIDAFEQGILMSILGECALALENERNAREKEEAAILAENEQLRANLLRTISHDLRTPLTSISGNASNLMNSGDSFDEATKQRLYADIYDDAVWLINLIENLLSVTRMEGGGVKLRATAELVDEVVEEALQHLDRKSAEHRIAVHSTGELLLARMDARLIVQVIINIVNNAVKYTPAGSEIAVETYREEKMAVIRIADDGPGIPDEMKPQIFELFYTGEHPVKDGRRSLGLGLALCRSIVTAHGGTIRVSDAQPHGAVFTFTLPLEEVQLHE